MRLPVLYTGLLMLALASPRLGSATPVPAEFAPRDELIVRKPDLGQVIEIRLRNGAQYKGELVRLLERESISLSISSSERLSFRWDDLREFRILETLEHRQYREQLEAEGRVEQSLRPGDVFVRTFGDKSIALKTYRLDDEGKPTEMAIDGDCKGGDLCVLSAGRTYFADSDHMPRSGEFQLPNVKDQRITLKLHSGSRAMSIAGPIIAVTGAVLSLASVFVGAIGDLDGSDPGRRAGVSLAVLGIASIVTGSVMASGAAIGVDINVEPSRERTRGFALGRAMRLTGSGLAF